MRDRSSYIWIKFGCTFGCCRSRIWFWFVYFGHEIYDTCRLRSGRQIYIRGWRLTWTHVVGVSFVINASLRSFSLRSSSPKFNNILGRWTCMFSSLLMCFTCCSYAIVKWIYQRSWEQPRYPLPRVWYLSITENYHVLTLSSGVFPSTWPAFMSLISFITVYATPDFLSSFWFPFCHLVVHVEYMNFLGFVMTCVYALITHRLLHQLVSHSTSV